MHTHIDQPGGSAARVRSQIETRSTPPRAVRAAEQARWEEAQRAKAIQLEEETNRAAQAQLEAATASEQLKGAVDKAGRAEEREAKQVQSAKDDAAQVISPPPLPLSPPRQHAASQWSHPNPAQRPRPTYRALCAQVKRLEQERDAALRERDALTATVARLSREKGTPLEMLAACEEQLAKERTESQMLRAQLAQGESVLQSERKKAAEAAAASDAAIAQHAANAAEMEKQRGEAQKEAKDGKIAI